MRKLGPTRRLQYKNKVKDKILKAKELYSSYKTIISIFSEQKKNSLNDYQICQFNKCKSNAERANTLLELLKLDHLHPTERGTIQAICTKYNDIFHLPGDKLTTTNSYEHNIYLKPDASPVYTKPYSSVE